MNKYSFAAIIMLAIAWLSSYVAMFDTIFMPKTFAVLTTTAFASVLTSLILAIKSRFVPNPASRWVMGLTVFFSSLTLAWFGLTAFTIWAFSSTNVH